MARQKLEECTYFTEAYKAWTGEKWNWKHEDGSENHPIDSSDEEVVAFYLGFRYAKKVSLKLEKHFIEIPEMIVKLRNLETEAKKFKREK